MARSVTEDIGVAAVSKEPSVDPEDKSGFLDYTLTI
jgi:hypothetical protein